MAIDSNRSLDTWPRVIIYVVDIYKKQGDSAAQTQDPDTTTVLSCSNASG